jgi:predicted NBD/HSP70 family sugar kinase
VSGSGVASPMLRRINAQSVLAELLRHGPMSGTDLMAATALSRPTVHIVCDDLIARGWVVELERRRPDDASRPGRRARVYAPRADGGYVVGVDMGVSTVRAAVADLRGTVVGETAVPVPDPLLPGPDRVARTREVAAAALRAAGVAPAHVLAAALGVPAPVGPDGHAVALEEYLPGFAGIDLRAAFHPLLDVPPLLDNDANLAVLGERWLGAATGADDAVLLLAGERFGSGICVGGHLVRGHVGSAGEMGFLGLVAGVGSTDGIGRLARRLGRQAAAGPARSLRERAGGDPGRVRAEDVFDLARDGDPAALAVLDAVAERAARVLAILMSLLDPEVIVVGGAVAEAGDVLLGALTAALRHRGNPVSARSRLAMSPLHDRGAVLGAVRTALDDVHPRLLDLAPPVAARP